MKALRAHGFNQCPRFEQVVGYLERNEPLPLDQPDRKATSFITSHFYLDDFVQSSKDPGPCSTRPCRQFPRKASHSRRGHGRGRAPCADAPRRKPLGGRPCSRPGGRRADEQRAGPAFHHGPSAQRCRRRAGGSARFFAEHASLQSTLLCRARSCSEQAPVQSTLLCRARFFAEHAPG